MSPSASSGVAASRTSTPARRNPVEVSLSVMTTTLYNDDLLPRHVLGDAQQPRMRDDAQVADLRSLAGEVTDHDAERQRIPEVHLGGHPLERPIDGAFHLQEALRPCELSAKEREARELRNARHRIGYGEEPIQGNASPQDIEPRPLLAAEFPHQSKLQRGLDVRRGDLGLKEAPEGRLPASLPIGNPQPVLGIGPIQRDLDVEQALASLGGFHALAESPP